MNFPLHNTRLIVEKYFSLPDLFVAFLYEKIKITPVFMAPLLSLWC